MGQEEVYAMIATCFVDEIYDGKSYFTKDEYKNITRKI
jgi:hypothetical protein